MVRFPNIPPNQKAHAMPISQDRILRLLEAGEAYREYFISLGKSMMLICARSDEFNTIPQITDEMRLQLNMALLRHRDADQVLAEERANYKHTHAHNAAKRERLREQRNQARAKGELTTKPRNSDYTIPQHAPNHNLPDNTPTKLIPKENIDVEMDRVRALKNPDYLKYKASLEKPTQEHHQGPTTGLESIQIEDEE